MTARVTGISLKRLLHVLVLTTSMFPALELSRRCASGDTLGDGPDIESKVRINVEVLKNDESVVMRAGAAKALGNIGPDAADGTPVLAETLLKDKHPMVRAQAAKALGKIGSGTEQGVLALNKALCNDEEVKVGRNAFQAFVRIGDIPRPP